MPVMHELSIAVSLIEIACEEAESLGAGRVSAVHLRIGRLSGVACDALRFSFEVAAAGTMVADARLVIDEVPVAVYCNACDREEQIAEPWLLQCPTCGTPTPEVLRGREMELRAIEIDD
jgi:hydrogenase nickel incorporation protein HypA/HybF